MRVLFQLFSPTHTDLLARTRDELRARDISTEVSTKPDADLSPFLLVHLFGFDPLSFTLRGVLNAVRQQKPFVITPYYFARSFNGSPEIQEFVRAFEHSAQQFLLHHAARIFFTSPQERAALVHAFDVDSSNMRAASTEAYAQSYQELARSSTRVYTHDERALRALEDTALASSSLTYRADEYYYQTLTPQLKRDAQRAREMEAALLERKR